MNTVLLLRSKPAGAPFSPSDIAGLQLWLKADTQVFTDAAGTIIANNDGDVIGCWKDQSGNAYDVSQATTAKKPLLKLGANGINNQPTILFDGIDDIINRVVANWLAANSAGTVIVVTRVTTLVNMEVLLASADEATANYWFYVAMPYNTTTTVHPFVSQKNADTADIVRGNTTEMAAATTYVFIFRSSGTAYSIRVNTVDEALVNVSGVNTGDWLADTPNRDNLSVGGLKYVGTEAQQINANISEVLVYDSEITGTDITDLETYLNTKYGAW